MSERFVIHADMDAFFASVEQRDHPQLRGKPVIVGGGEGRGVVAAASYEARKFGVRSAMPGFEARRLCPQGIFVRPNFSAYSQASSDIHRIFADFTDQVEGLALDEAFLDVTQSAKLFGSPLAMAQLMKSRIKEELGLTVSCGIAHNKLVAKLACSRGKPDGLLWIRPEEVKAFMYPLPIRALFGIGPKSEARLVKNGLTTIGAVARAPLLRLQDLFGDHAEELRARAQGIDPRPVAPRGRRKSIGEEHTFSQDLHDGPEVRAALRDHAFAVARRAQKSALLGYTISVKCKLSVRREGEIHGPQDIYPSVSRQLTLDAPTNDPETLLAAGSELLRQLELPSSIRLLGLTLSRLVDEDEPRQLCLFENALLF